MSSIWKAGTNHALRAGLTCLLLSLVLLGVFQFQTAGRSISFTLTPFTMASHSLSGDTHVKVRAFKGYETWKEMLERFSKPRPIGESVVASCLATGTLLVIASPFLLGLLAHSRLLWRLAFASSVLVAVGVTGLVIRCRLIGGASPTPWDNPTPTTLALLIWFPLFHLCGMLFIRPAQSAQLS